MLTAIFAGHPIILPFGLLGRPDHHAFIMLFMLIHLHYIIKIVESGFENKNVILKTALVTVLCVWISPETLIPLVLADAVLVVYFFFHEKMLWGLFLKNILVTFGIGVIAFIPPQNGFFSIVLLLLMATPYVLPHYQRLPQSVLKYYHVIPLAFMLFLLPSIAVEYDKISVLHVVLYLCSVIFLGAAMVNEKYKEKDRILASILWLLVISAVFLFIYPKFLHGMEADIDDYLKKIWLSKISEMQSPFVRNQVHFVSYALIMVMGLVHRIRNLIGENSKNFGNPMTAIWWILIADSI
ncbi:MAG: hypothetical protein LBB29_01255 [Holosporaceae bacterium]|nr:hypothetical protein [Holosporaceae bacterium]